MRAVLISIQPKWVFLIIAQKMGWDIGKEKTIEVRKGFPKAVGWNKKVKIYCSKNKKSFAEIPKTYQPLMEKFLGKVIGEFVCDEFFDLRYVPTKYFGKPAGTYETFICENSCLSFDEIKAYANGKHLYGWHISDLKIYDKPKELSEFEFPKDNIHLSYRKRNQYFKGITRPPQSWCYVEELQNG